MSFATINWYKKIIVSTAIFASSYGFEPLPLIADEAGKKKFDFKYHGLSISEPESEQSPEFNSSCSEIDAEYEDVYNFEVKNYYVNICQLKDNFYYHRKSKIDARKNILIPAQKVFGDNVYQASAGKTIYFVGQDGGRYYSSVMQNNNEIVIEPQLLPTPKSFSQEIVDSGLDFYFSSTKLSSSYRTTSAKNWLAVSPQAQRSEPNALLCMENSTNLDSGLESWQKLLGKSTEIANKYAMDNGHIFVYHDGLPNQASIETKGGRIIDLNIAAASETIEQICERRIIIA